MDRCAFDDTPTAIGFYYEDGWPFVKNMDDAIWWYRLAVERGYANGMNNLGNLYC